MPPRARARKSHLKTDLTTELPSRTTVQLPQELIDAIIDELDPSLTSWQSRPVSFPDRKTLRSCALVARAFVRPSQANLFSTVNLCSVPRYTYSGDSPDERSRLFSKLLSSKPHIRLYVRTLLLSYRCARSNSVVHILSSLPKLRTFSLHPSLKASYGQHLYPAFPIQLRESFLAVFSAASLRRLELRNHQFENAPDLEQILSSSLGLKELSLTEIRFTDVSSGPSQRSPPSVVLETLEVLQIQTSTIAAILNSFTIVDITHLHSISCDRYHISLLQANAHSIQKLTLREGVSISSLYPGALDQILPLKTSLRSLNLRLSDVYMVANIIPRLGNLASLESVKQLSITTSRVPPSAMFQVWERLDSQLAGVGSGLEEIHMGFVDYKEGDEAALRHILPILDAKGVLRISSVAAVDAF